MFFRTIESVAGLYVLVAQASGVPTVDIEKTCRSSEQAIIAIFGTQTAITYDNCLQQEKDARERMIKNWSQYPAVDRERCAKPKGYMPSYVEWLTCFEMEGDVRKLRLEKPKG
jgi:hypothetical protein